MIHTISEAIDKNDTVLSFRTDIIPTIKRSKTCPSLELINLGSTDCIHVCILCRSLGEYALPKIATKAITKGIEQTKESSQAERLRTPPKRLISTVYGTAKALNINKQASVSPSKVRSTINVPKTDIPLNEFFLAK